MTLRERIEALHDEYAATARSYGSYEDDQFVSGRVSGRQEMAEEIRDEIAHILKEFPT